jgi:bacterioferritin
MDKTSKEIAIQSIDATTQILKKGYATELSAFHYFWYISQNIQGIGVLEKKFFEDRANEELENAKSIASRLVQLKVTPIDDPAKWEQDSELGKLQPSKYLTFRSALEKALEFERAAIKSYNDLANTAKDKDHATYNLALELLKAELKDEQDLEDLLSKLEIR